MIPAVLALCAAFLSCTPANERMTRISGTLSGENVPDSISVQYWVESTDSPVKSIRIPVVDGRFEAEIPTCVTQFSAVIVERDYISFIADGTTLSIDPATHRITSSNPDGVQSHYNAWYQEWLDLEHEVVAASYALKDRKENGEDTSVEELALEKDHYRRLADIHKNVLLKNRDNVVAARAISALESADSKLALSLLGEVSDELKKNNTTLQFILPTLEARASTAIGDMFADFEVVQDPAHPETSTVKLSDYVGKGKAVLMVLWASWCEQNQREMPGLKQLYEKYHGDTFDMLSVAVSDAPEYSLAAAKEMGISWNLIVNAQSIPLELYGVRNIPDMILFGPDGTILLRGFWGYDDQTLETIIKKYVFHT